MQQVQCYECGWRYDYDEDGFCPRCGAFNQPPRESRVSADGTVIRLDGLNEKNHADSFVHRELHSEKRQRRRTGLDKSMTRVPQAEPVSGAKKAGKMTLGKLIGWAVLAFTILNLLSGVLSRLF